MGDLVPHDDGDTVLALTDRKDPGVERDLACRFWISMMTRASPRSSSIT
jgi:hypothetical protein